MAAVVEGTGAVPAWFGDVPRGHHRTGEYSRSPHEWMPRPWAGRVMVSKNKTTGEGVYLQVVPGPEGLFQVVRVDLSKPVARGFRTPQAAERWVARAVGAGILPSGVVLVEPPPARPVSDP
jgi:hypothetical protein